MTSTITRNSLRAARLRPALLTAALLLALAALAPACELTSSSCPGKLQSAGNLTLTYKAVDKGDTCRITAQSDGGPANAPLAVTPTAAVVSLCAGQDDAGVITVAIAIGSSGYRTTTLDGGSFALTATTPGAGATACICPIDLVETLTGTLLQADGGTIAFGSDGGLLPLSSLSGALDDAVKATAGVGASCSCNLPCGIHYSLAGTPQ